MIVTMWCHPFQVQEERDELYRKFVKAIHEVQQKSNFKNLLLEKKLCALVDTLEKKEAQLNEVLSASNLDPAALTVVTRKLEVTGDHIKVYTMADGIMFGFDNTFVVFSHRIPEHCIWKLVNLLP